MDIGPAILIFTPILLPIMAKLGVDPVHFGIIAIYNGDWHHYAASWQWFICRGERR